MSRKMAYEQGSALYNVYGEFFFKQGRSSDFTSRGCVSLCIVMYQQEETEEVFCDEFVHKSRPYMLFIQKSIHAEEIILNAIKKTEESEKVKCIRLELYSSMSPCTKCCNLLHDFISERSECEVHLAFSCVYSYGEDEHKFALREVGLLGNVKLLDVFNVREWCLLRERGFLDMSPEALRSMQIWDQYWRRKLKEIMTCGTFQEDNFPYHEDLQLDGGEEPYDCYFMTPIESNKSVELYEGRNRCVIIVLAIVLLVTVLVLAWLLYFAYKQYKDY